MEEESKAPMTTEDIKKKLLEFDEDSDEPQHTKPKGERAANVLFDFEIDDYGNESHIEEIKQRLMQAEEELKSSLLEDQEDEEHQKILCANT
jgi:hypothetical protein